MRDFRQLSYSRFLVHKLLPIKISKLGAIESDTEVSAKDSLAFLNNTVSFQSQTHAIGSSPPSNICH